MTTVLIVLAVIVLIIALFHFWCFYFIFHRLNIGDSLPKQTIPYKEQIKECSKWFEKAPYKKVYTTSYDGIRLAARFYEHSGSDKTIILFHGYRSLGEKDFSCALEYYHNLGLNILMIYQRAHSESGGKFITFGIKERYDVISWCEYINTVFKNGKIVLGGMSMGSSTVLMASGLKLPKNVKGIIADCGYTSPKDIITKVAKQVHIPPFFFLPTVNWMCRVFAGFDVDDYSTLRAMKTNKIPILFVHGKNDNFVPYDMSVKNYEACVAEKRLVSVEDADHGMSWLVDNKSVSGALKEFLHNVGMIESDL